MGMGFLWKVPWDGMGQHTFVFPMTLRNRMRVSECHRIVVRVFDVIHGDLLCKGCIFSCYTGRRFKLRLWILLITVSLYGCNT